MSLFKFKQFSLPYNQDLENRKKIVQLTEKYEPTFLNYINNKEVDSEKLNQGIQEIAQYVSNSLIFKFRYGFESHKPLEKKGSVLFSKIESICKYNEINIISWEEEFLDIVMNNIYNALGIGEKKKKVFKKHSQNSYFIKYVQSLAFYDLLNYLENKLLSFEQNSSTILLESKQDNFYLKTLLEKTGLKESIPEDIYIEFHDMVLNGEEIPVAFKPYWNILVDKAKDDYEDIFN